MKNSQLIQLQKTIRIKFKSQNLLIKSLTHKSFDSILNYEKLEFLGDRVLGLIISKKLLELYPNEKEGTLDKELASLVNKNTCFTIGNKIELSKYIFLGNKSKSYISANKKIVSDCIEALIGAIYLDKGLDVVEKFILFYWGSFLKNSKQTEIDAKTRLQEYSLKKFKLLPIYKLISNTGPRHSPVFKVGVKLQDTKFFEARGTSKKDAEQNAAKKVILFLGNELAR